MDFIFGYYVSIMSMDIIHGFFLIEIILGIYLWLLSSYADGAKTCTLAWSFITLYVISMDKIYY